MTGMASFVDGGSMKTRRVGLLEDVKREEPVLPALRGADFVVGTGRGSGGGAERTEGCERRDFLGTRARRAEVRGARGEGADSS